MGRKTVISQSGGNILEIMQAKDGVTDRNWIWTASFLMTLS